MQPCLEYEPTSRELLGGVCSLKLFIVGLLLLGFLAWVPGTPCPRYGGAVHCPVFHTQGV